MSVTMLVLLFVSNDFSLQSTGDLIGVSLCLFVAGVITWNCISNFLLLKVSGKNTNPFFPRRILFWVITILFFLACIFLILCILASYPILSKKFYDKKFEYYGLIVVILWMLIIALNGLYIFIRQIQLFLKVTRMNRETSIQLLAEIGEPLP